jgi:hypothetical protein
MKASLKKVLTWLGTHWRWSQLRALGSSRLVQASLLMPAFGYLLLLNDNVHDYLKIKYDGWLLPHLPSLWRIWFLYYGSISLAVGSILFAWFCPIEIKRYASSFEIVRMQRDLDVQEFSAEQLRGELQSAYKKLSRWAQSLYPIDFSDTPLGAPSSDLGTTVLIHRWRMMDVKWPVVRLTVFVLFSIGLLLVAVPAAVTFVQVSFVLLGRGHP